ncbi:MAG: NAD(P)-binding protein [Taibaiella sp.]|nr:NAD(P)-binding protein [Taibaiella sp.]
MERRQFIRWMMTVSGGLGLGLTACRSKRNIPGSIVGASAAIGHLLRDKVFERPAVFEERKVVIVGGGISGLSAAMHLHKARIEEVLLLELEAHTGGNAASGSNEYSKFPYGAHYVPIPNNQLTDYMAFLEEAGVITGYENGLPVYNELYLCHDPEDRLYINGKWQEGIVPNHGLSDTSKHQFTRFFEEMARLRKEKGKDGRDAFAIPVDLSSADPLYTALDQLTFKEWLTQQAFNADELLWYANYCTLDDFGTTIEQISAWAGIHYFAARKGLAANAHYDDVLTWEQGNGFLAEQLLKRSQAEIRTNSLVVAVEEVDSKIELIYYDVPNKAIKGLRCEQCIIAAPQFVNARMLGSADPERVETVKANMQYSPWIVANLKVKAGLEERNGVDLSWDNVIYGGNGLGYVDAGHQKISLSQPVKNLTYYKPLKGASNAEARKVALAKQHKDWVDEILSDLLKVHPNLEQQLLQADIALWGHAMIQPLPGWIWGAARKSLQQSIGNKIHFAHTDIAGVSIFEEAFYQGLNAAGRVKQFL